jgi:small subunit ribosomal protein S16
MVALRLRREGCKGRPYYRIVATTHTKKRDGAFLESLGTYDPMKEGENATVDLAKVDAWVTKGAQMSDTVLSIVKRHRRAARAAAAAK